MTACQPKLLPDCAITCERRDRSTSLLTRHNTHPIDHSPDSETRMTESEFMAIVREVRKIDDPSFLDIPLEAAPFDSLDLLELRASLETRLNLPLTDEKFNSASTLRDLYLLVNR